MRKLLLTLALAAAALLGHAQEVIVMDKAMFIDKVFDYENSKEKVRAGVEEICKKYPLYE